MYAPTPIQPPPPKTKNKNQGWDKSRTTFLCNIWNQRNERPIVGGVSIRSWNGAPSRKGCVVNGQMPTRHATNAYAPSLALSLRFTKALRNTFGCIYLLPDA